MNMGAKPPAFPAAGSSLAEYGQSQSYTGDGRYCVLIADHDATRRRRLASDLEGTAGFAMTQMTSLPHAQAALLKAADRFDALLLGSRAQGIEAGLLARDLRRRNCTVPIIVLTDSDDEDGTVFALDSGADDVVAKPVRVRELMARLRRHLLRYRDGDEIVLTLGSYEFRPGERTIMPSGGDTRIDLTAKECGILALLHRANGAPVLRDRLLRDIWGYGPTVTTHTLETHVYRLRQKLETTPGRGRLIVTESGGYRLAPTRSSRRER